MNIILIVFVDGVSAGRRMKYCPHPKPLLGELSPPSPSHGEKFSNIESPNGTISTRIFIYR
jgi:hypothetical protein